MTEEIRANELFARILRGNQSFNVVLSTGIRGILLLVQHLYRMRKEKLLSGGEVESFEKFVKATGGRYDIVNVPVPDEGPEAIDGFRQMMEERKIRFHLLPDLNEGDNRIQVCVYQPDAERFAGCFRDYIEKQLTGGEMVEGSLWNLTSGHASLISVPGEERIDEFRKDFDRLRINYAVMPDLRVGDGQVQILVANSDLQKMRQWYSLYQQDMLRKGERIEDFRSMSMEEYRVTAEMSAEDYIGTSTPDIKETLQKYEGREKGEFEKAIDVLEDQIGTADSPMFEKYLKNRSYEMLSIDEASLVEGVNPMVLPDEARTNFVCRIPGMPGSDGADGISGAARSKECYLSVPKNQVFWLESSYGDRYLAFVKADAAPTVYDYAGKKNPVFPTGKDLMRHFESAKEKLAEKELENSAKIAAKLIHANPVPNPVLAK